MPDGEHPLKQHAQDAIAVQDACNMSGVAHSFSRALHAMCEMGMDTTARNRHPITILFADKIHDLAGLNEKHGAALNADEYHRVYIYCKRLVAGQGDALLPG